MKRRSPTAATSSLRGALLFAGRLGDRFAPRSVLVAGLAGFVVATLGVAVSHGLTELVAWRVAQRLCGGVFTPQLLTMLELHVPPSMRGAAMTAYGSVIALAFFVGPALTGLAAVLASWRLFFFATVPLSVGALIVIAVTTPRGARPGEARLDAVSAAMSAVARRSWGSGSC